MALKKIDDIHVGKIDGKHEFLQPSNRASSLFEDTFLMPDNVRLAEFDSNETYFISGIRGTGKTSLLRWYAERLENNQGYIGELILFKTGLRPSQRQEISRQAGIDWADISSEQMEIVQDFKDAWIWYIFHKIGELIRDDKINISNNDKKEAFLRLLGLAEQKPFNKVLGFLPRIHGTRVKVKADTGFFQGELEGDLVTNGTDAEVRLDALNQAAERIFSRLEIQTPFYIFLDELEVFYHHEDQYNRDLRMVRDLINITDYFNDLILENGYEAKFVAAIRSEVIEALGSEGEEINRLIHDRGIEIAWHHSNRDLNHPLLNIVRHKIWASERYYGCTESEDPLRSYFPHIINNETVDKFLLDQSFYKPRDLVWRLSIAKRNFPDEPFFTQDVLDRTKNEYSARLWDEVKYELSATYSDNEIKVIESIFSGKNIYFNLDDIDRRLSNLAHEASVARELASRKSVRQILHDLYRLGAIGNAFRAGNRQIRNRWVFRGDPTLLPDKRMQLNPALMQRLSAKKN